MRNLKVKYRKPSDFKETCKEFTAQVEEKASFDKYNINNCIDSINKICFYTFLRKNESVLR
jgi:hypothetical protein